ncbi:hypothetical protein F5984_23705 [Rudanella paleaurantiibacter]|uniref:PKD domain-containing protein n=1 Tax=Rudanella paleaurantiibacter TaxID=2614655 RepID=A0A7J5TSR9_9BACT|nr:FG-GAP repeat protein [Rudanella paleaurantiibacter]KAB7726636.1 hypothetical protein F5984_23705 [Rudanella paleaurantiibacter]
MTQHLQKAQLIKLLFSSSTAIKLIFYFLIACTLQSSPVQAQIGMGGQPHPSAVLDLKTTDKAFYPPRLTTSQRKAIANPQAGAFVYDLDQNSLYLYDGTSWLPLSFANIPPINSSATDGAAFDSFGLVVAISGDYALIGAFGDDFGSTQDQGSAYIFMRSENSWVQQAKLIASDGASGDTFGRSVAISGDYALIGAPGDDLSKGSAYVFMRTGTTWTQQGKLVASDGTASDYFGFSVALSGDYALVGAYYDDNRKGSAYMFMRDGTTWTQKQKLTADNGVVDEYFGYNLALSGDYALVGAYGESQNKGSAYVYMRTGTTWTRQSKLVASDGVANDYFGYSVAISGDYALVGAYKDDNGKGAAYIFVRDGSNWTQQEKITANDGLAGDGFGCSVALSGSYALVGAREDDLCCKNDQGSAYLFVRNTSTWKLVRKITDNAPAGTNNGYSVSLSNNAYIIGGPYFQNYQGKVAFGIVEN